MSLDRIIKLWILLGISRRVLRYLEQYAKHHIAFRLLGIIRDRVFKALRRLGPVKLDGKDKESLITIITGDIELLEVFYVHTISPCIYSLIIVIYPLSFH